MKHTKLILSIVMVLIGMIVPTGMKLPLSDWLFGAIFMWIIVNQDFFFGDDTKKATSHGNEK